MGFEATSTSEFGGTVAFTGAERTNPTVTVLMSSWGCQSRTSSPHSCQTTPGATFSEPITLNIYNTGTDTPGAAPGTLIASVTKTFAIPYRPSANPAQCSGNHAGQWYDSTTSTCYSGLATPVVFALDKPGLTLPSQAVITVAYDTSNYGAHPFGTSTACFKSAAGCGYDSLNVAVTAPPTVGSDPLPNDAYLNSSWPGAYCSTTNPGIGSLALDTGCWTGYEPAIEVQTPAVTTLTAKPSVAQILPGLSVNLKLSAVLSAGPSPVSGQPVEFSAGGQRVCSATTGPDGTATCSGTLTGVLPSVLNLGYQASFAGRGFLQPSSTKGSVLTIGPFLL